jgi:hypothetical protein
MNLLLSVLTIIAAEAQKCFLLTVLILAYIYNLGFVPIIEAWSGTQSLFISGVSRGFREESKTMP